MAHWFTTTHAAYAAASASRLKLLNHFPGLQDVQQIFAEPILRAFPVPRSPRNSCRFSTDSPSASSRVACQPPSSDPVNSSQLSPSIRPPLLSPSSLFAATLLDSVHPTRTRHVTCGPAAAGRAGPFDSGKNNTPSIYESDSDWFFRSHFQVFIFAVQVQVQLYPPAGSLPVARKPACALALEASDSMRGCIKKWFLPCLTSQFSSAHWQALASQR